jgi:hypothetical protein
MAVLLLGLLLPLGIAVMLGRDRRQPSAAAPPRPVSVLHQSRESAVRAAVDALYALSVPSITDRRRFEEAVARLAASGAEDHVRAVFGDTDPGLVAAFRHKPSVLRGAPLGYRIDRYQPGTASVAIWSVAIAGAKDRDVQSQWRTLVVDLAWTPQGWRVTHGTGVDGPSPATPQAELAIEVAGFRSFHYVP